MINVLFLTGIKLLNDWKSSDFHCLLLMHILLYMNQAGPGSLTFSTVVLLLTYHKVMRADPLLSFP